MDPSTDKSISDSNACFAGSFLGQRQPAVPHPALLTTCILELATELLQAILFPRNEDKSSLEEQVFSVNGEPFNGEPLPFFPTTNPYPNPGLCFFLQLASWNLQLSFNKYSGSRKEDKSSLWKNRFFPCRTENHSTVNRFLCSFLPLNPYPVPAFFNDFLPSPAGMQVSVLYLLKLRFFLLPAFSLCIRTSWMESAAGRDIGG